MSGAGSWTFHALLGLLVLQRVVDLVLSRRNLGRLAPGARVSDPGWNWAAMVALHAGLVVLPAVEAHARGRVAPTWLLGAAAGLFAVAQVLRLWAIRSLGPAWNARGMVAPGTEVVDRGPYRWMRHPNYLAVVLEFVAVPVAGGAWLAGLVLNGLHALVLARRIRGEEELLEALPGYRERMAGKGGLWPRRPPASGR